MLSLKALGKNPSLSFPFLVALGGLGLEAASLFSMSTFM